MHHRLAAWWRSLRFRGDFERGMNEEMRFHMERYTEDLERSGMPADEARRRARLEFGDRNTIEDDCRRTRWLPAADEVARQVRYSVRLLRKSPGFTITAMATIAICLAANVALFAVVDAVLLRPLPFPDADRLVTVFNTYPKAGVDRDGSSITNYYERRGRIPALESLALYNPGSAVVGEAGATEREAINRITPDFFRTLGTGIALGRAFTEDETDPANSRVVILTDAYWREHYGRNPHAVGRTLRMDGTPFTIAGILPAGFQFLSSPARLYVPLASRPENRTPRERHSGGNSRHIVARLQPGATIEQAQAQIDAQNSALEATNPDGPMMAEAGFRSLVRPLQADHVATIRPTLLLMQAGAAALLLIGLVNLANLLLVRAAARARETAVRQALGAGRRHVILEALVETTTLAIAGGVGGVAFSAVAIRFLAAFAAERLPLGSRIAFDERAALVAFLAAVGLGLILAGPVAWFRLHGDWFGAFEAGSRSATPGRAAQSLRHAFIVGQVALATSLLAAAGLLGLSLQRAMSIPFGFDSHRVLTAQVSAPWTKYETWNARLALNARLMDEIARQPGVVATGIANNVPLSGNEGKAATAVSGYTPRPSESPRAHYAYGVDGDYFATMGIALREGRLLTAADSRRNERPCVVDEDYARFYWPGTRALGRRLFLGSDVGPDAQAFTVVGVVAPVKQAGHRDLFSQGAVYLPYALRTDDRLFLTVRTSLSPERLAPLLQQIVRRVDPELPVNDIQSMDARVDESLEVQRTPAFLAMVFSAIAILLTAVGTYGVLAYAVSQRRREIGIRMAVGAAPGRIRLHFIAMALRLLGVGVVLGAVGALGAGRALRTVLFQVPATQPLILAGAAVTVALISLVACLIPAHRASRVSPTEALS